MAKDENESKRQAELERKQREQKEQAKSGEFVSFDKPIPPEKPKK